MAVTSVNDTDSSTTLLGADSSREGASVFNDSTAILYLRQGLGTATTSDYSVQVGAGDYWESPHRNWVRGGMTGIWASDASGSAKITDW